MVTIINQRSGGRNIRIGPEGVTVNGKKVSREEDAQLRNEAQQKINRTFNSVRSSPSPRLGDVVVVQQAGKVVNIQGDLDVNISPNGTTRVRVHSKKR